VQAIASIYIEALDQLGITARVMQIDSAQYVERTNAYDFDMTHFVRLMSLSPGNEQWLYWGSEGVEMPGTRNLAGVDSPAVEAMITTMLETAPCPAPFNLAEYVLAEGARQPERIALQILRPTGAERWSYSRLIGAVRGIGTGLLRAGLAPGDRVLLRLGNTVDFPLAYLGAIAMGAVPVPTSSQLTAREITAMAADLEPAAVIAAEGIALPEPDTDRPARLINAKETWQAGTICHPATGTRGSPDRLAYMVFTSGSSGRARAVMHAHRASGRGG
jgi:non-ribosomal peptide synthetase component F